MTASFVAYIDESGCEGFKFLPNEQGSSRWFVLSALVFRKEEDLLAVHLAREARTLLRKPYNHALHFRDLKHEQRVPLARLIGQSRAQAVNVLIYKPSIATPELFMSQKYSLYQFATTLLAERVSWLCCDKYRSGVGDGRVELIFSNRSAMSYDDLRDHLTSLRRTDSGSASGMNWDVVDPALLRAVNHDQLAGLQLADAVASGVYFAVNRNQYGEIENRYLSLLSPILYRQQDKLQGYGLNFWCADKQEIKRIIGVAEHNP